MLRFVAVPKKVLNVLHTRKGSTLVLFIQNTHYGPTQKNVAKAADMYTRETHSLMKEIIRLTVSNVFSVEELQETNTA